MIFDKKLFQQIYNEVVDYSGEEVGEDDSDPSELETSTIEGLIVRIYIEEKYSKG